LSRAEEALANSARRAIQWVGGYMNLGRIIEFVQMIHAILAVEWMRVIISAHGIHIV
jgi:hypothetical protein